MDHGPFWYGHCRPSAKAKKNHESVSTQDKHLLIEKSGNRTLLNPSINKTFYNFHVWVPKGLSECSPIQIRIYLSPCRESMVPKQTSNQCYQCRSQIYNGTAPTKEALPFIPISNKTQRHPLHPHLLVDVRPKILNEYLPSLPSTASYYYLRNTIKEIHFSPLS